MTSLMYTLLPFILTIFFLFRFYHSHRPTTTTHPPPSPPKLPIVGNLHQIGPLIHRSFSALSRRYGGGHLMLLHLGSVPTLVVSSTDSAREIMHTHDLIFSDKPSLKIFKTIYYDSKEISVAPYGDHWRQSKKIIILHHLSTKKVQTFSPIRDQETESTLQEIEKLSKRNKVVNLGNLLMEYSNNVSCRATFGRRYNDRETGKKLRKVIDDFLEVMCRFYFVDSIPWLAWIDEISGANRRIESVAKGFDDFLESTIAERLAGRNVDDESSVEPFIDSLFKIEKEGVFGVSFDRDVIKALLMDAYLAGTETSSSLLEWVMAELLTHLTSLKKLQTEVRTIVSGKEHISDDDLQQMKYMKAVIMETARLHPPIPLSIARLATQDAKVMGFDVKKGTQVYINIWAIGRDPKVWDWPDEFIPERFEDEGSVDFVSHDFKFIPFGAGRRGCPGRGFGLAVVEKLLANLLWKFDWVLSDEVKEEMIKMKEAVGLGTHPKTPLLAFATPFSFHS